MSGLPRIVDDKGVEKDMVDVQNPERREIRQVEDVRVT